MTSDGNTSTDRSNLAAKQFIAMLSLEQFPLVLPKKLSAFAQCPKNLARTFLDKLHALKKPGFRDGMPG
ncbi:MAG: hypothetical protein COB90_06545 [Hyphomicrobiales bacterium]|nr:MAG: hypothetical protein COB90_06545 [Hyphomicrobiales bacterium]